MKELLDDITLETGDDEVLWASLNEIIARAEPDVAEAIRFCAVPHWLNGEIIAWLRGEGLKPSRRSRQILAALTELNFVSPYREWGWAYHEKVRDLLLRRWREADDEEFRKLSERAAGYFAHKLGEKEALWARLFAAGRRVLGKVETPTEYEREEYQRELMYHLLVTDPGQGLKLFRRMFEKAYRFYHLSTCALLLQLAGEQRAYLSANDRLWLRFHQGQLAQASAPWPEALTTVEGLWREEMVLSLEGTLAKDFGVVYQDKGEWERAIEYYERSLALKEKAGDEYGMAPTFHDLGLMYQYKGKLDKAIEYHRRSLAIMARMGDQHGMSRIFNSLGDVYQAKGEWERAIEYYERSLAILEEVGDEHGMATTFNSLGSVYRAKGEWDRAIEYYERSLAFQEKVGGEHGMAATFSNLGRVYQAKGEWDRAIECYERSLAIREKRGDEHGMAISCNNIAMLYRDQGRLQEAIPLFGKSLEIFERIGAKPSADTVRGNLERTKRELEAKTGQG
jgi:tetratricopeptide (TPR) repeat protein